MPALSSKDKLKLRLSAAKVERWNRERRKPVVNPTDPDKPIRCRSIQWAHGQEKPVPVYPDKAVVACDNEPMRLSCGKLTIVRRGDNFSDYQDADYSESPRDPVRVVREYKPRPNSPFKRAAKAAASVVIVRK